MTFDLSYTQRRRLIAVSEGRTPRSIHQETMRSLEALNLIQRSLTGWEITERGTSSLAVRRGDRPGAWAMTGDDDGMMDARADRDFFG